MRLHNKHELAFHFPALEAGIPFLSPYLKNGSDFSHGVNFAVSGATALSASCLAAKGVTSPITNTSFDVQLDWMSTFFSSAFHNIDTGSLFFSHIFPSVLHTKDIIKFI